MSETTGAHATSKPRLPYGTWPSPIGPALLGQVGDTWSRFDRPEPTADATYWLESRPVEGRVVLVRRPIGGEAVDLTPPGFDVRNDVHEYGGGAYFLDGTTVYFSNHGDGRLYGQAGDGAPVAITPEASPGAVRYAEGVVVPGGPAVLCVRETHGPARVEHDIVAVATDGSREPCAVVTGHDFVAFPCVHPDGTHLAWTSWDLPGLPFHGTRLWVAPLRPDGKIGRPTYVAGGDDESIFQPRWSPSGDLHFVSDRTGWWNLYRVRPGKQEPLLPLAAETGWPQWLCSLSSYAFLADGRIACIVNDGAEQRLVLIDPERARFEEPDFPFTAICVPQLRAHGSRAVLIAATDTTAPAVIGWDAETGRHEMLAGGVELDPGLVSTPRRLTFRSRDGSVGRARFYPPAHPDVVSRDGETPPLVVMAHGGPTDQAPHGLRLDVQLFTSRGIAVLDVDYAGSTGYGRAFADRLRGRWGLSDVHDCVDAALELAARGDVDRARMAILGGSAGGYLVLCALAYHEVFAAGVSFYGISDLTAFAHGTHAFESGYVKWLVGAPVGGPEYRLRSPVFAADAVRQPLLLLHGSDDRVVPPGQSAEMATAVERASGSVRHVVLPGEGHGFRRAASIEHAYTEVLDFLGQVFKRPGAG